MLSRFSLPPSVRAVAVPIMRLAVVPLAWPRWLVWSIKPQEGAFGGFCFLGVWMGGGRKGGGEMGGKMWGGGGKKMVLANLLDPAKTAQPPHGSGAISC